MGPREGMEAPDFELPDHRGGVVKLSSLRGRCVVLYFFPRAFTQGCTVEAVEFSRLLPEFNKLNVVVLGISTDSVATLKRFAERHSLEFSLLSDKGGNVARAYGVLRPTGAAERVTFIVDPRGIVAKVISGVAPRDHPRLALEYVGKVGCGT